MNRGLETCILYLDKSLIYKLEQYGIKGKVLLWIKSFNKLLAIKCQQQHICSTENTTKHQLCICGVARY